MTGIPHLEAVTVCVGYGDFLAETVKWNLPMFERWIVVTSPDDAETREVCRKNSLEVILSEEHLRHKAVFNKGRLSERGLQHTSSEGFRVHIDADMALPHRFRHALESADLKKTHIYGIDRLMVRNFDQWKCLVASGYMQGGQYTSHCNVTTPPGIQLGTRWAHPQMGYCPIGFFQLWHSSQDEWKGIRIRPYPTQHGNACRSDVQHALRWDRAHRSVIPEVFGVHLESEQTKNGANWTGRTTKRFGLPLQKGPWAY